MVARIIPLILLLTACSSPQVVYRTQTVSVPVVVRPEPPEALSAPYRPHPLPMFVQPSDPNARVALTAEGLDNLKVILRTLTTRDDAWRAWATTKEPQ
ncbi:hypothetical protein D9M69_618670 [compost metagenome]